MPSFFSFQAIQKPLKNDAQNDIKTRVGKSMLKVIKIMKNGLQKGGQMESTSVKQLKNCMLKSISNFIARREPIKIEKIVSRYDFYRNLAQRVSPF